MRPFDEKFADKVREVFDHHQEPFDPKAWEALQVRLSKKRQTRFISMIPLSARIAASLLIIATITWVSFMVFSPGRTYLSETDTSSPAVSDAEDQRQKMPHDDSIHRPTPSQQDFTSQYAGAIQPSDHTAITTKETETIPHTSHAKTNDVAGLAFTETGKDSVEYVQPVLAIEELVTDDRPRQLLTDTPKLQVEHPTQGTPPNDIMLIEEQAYLYQIKDERKITWGVAASSILAYTGKDAGSGIGFSGGLTTEYRLSKSVRVASGLLLAYQQFGSESMPALSRSSRNEMFHDHDAVSVSAEHDYELLVMDIPLNIQLRLPASKNREWQLTTGLSSLLYLQQEMSGKETIAMETVYYDQLSSSYRTQSFLTEVEVSSSYEPFSRFDFARLLNLSVGYAITQKKTTTVIEPYVKLPLGAISSRELKMGMGGLSLRLNFGH